MFAIALNTFGILLAVFHLTLQVLADGCPQELIGTSCGNLESAKLFMCENGKLKCRSCNPGERYNPRNKTCENCSGSLTSCKPNIFSGACSESTCEDNVSIPSPTPELIPTKDTTDDPVLPATAKPSTITTLPATGVSEIPPTNEAKASDPAQDAKSESEPEGDKNTTKTKYSVVTSTEKKSPVHEDLTGQLQSLKIVIVFLCIGFPFAFIVFYLYHKRRLVAKVEKPTHAMSCEESIDTEQRLSRSGGKEDNDTTIQ